MPRKDNAAQGGHPSSARQRSEGDGLSVCHHYRTESHPVSRAVFHLQRRTEKSFYCKRPTVLCDWLRARGYTDKPATSANELARLRTAEGGLVIVYHSGSFVIGGPDCAAEIVRALFEQLVQERYPMVPEFVGDEKR